jgi:pimeloyl-ACP methyl ester carboxylesterase
MWHSCETGCGPPVILLHGIGMSHAVWKAVTPRLRLTRRVIAFDIAGFGSTPPLPTGTRPTIRNLVDGLSQSLQEMGIDVPVDIAGNSLGGAMALEAARRGLAKSVVAISPIGLWEHQPAPHVGCVFSSLRFMATTAPGAMKAMLWNPLLREIAFAVPISVGSWRMPAREAFRAVDDLAASTAFEDTFDSTRTPFFATEIDVPVTVAFGRRDWILTKSSRRRDRLPASAMWMEKDGWGHVPMWVDPIGVALLILEGTRCTNTSIQSRSIGKDSGQLAESCRF